MYLEKLISTSNNIIGAYLRLKLNIGSEDKLKSEYIFIKIFTRDGTFQNIF